MPDKCFHRALSGPNIDLLRAHSVTKRHALCDVIGILYNGSYLSVQLAWVLH